MRIPEIYCGKMGNRMRVKIEKIGHGDNDRLNYLFRHYTGTDDNQYKHGE